jgi:hypothetical protein
MVGAHLLQSQLAVDVLEHLLQNLYHLVGLDVVACLLGWVLDSAVLPSWVHLFLQWSYSADQPVGSHTNPSQVEPFSSLTKLVRAITKGILDSIGFSNHVPSYSRRQPTKGGGRLGS